VPARALPDFKITDGVSYNQRFKSLTIRKTDELVGYGLGGQKRPSIQDHGGQHVEADAYHDLMKDPDAVIIDVRNAYESAVGHFAPPTGGAELIDPKMVRRRRPACVSSLSLTTVCSAHSSSLLLSPALSCSLPAAQLARLPQVAAGARDAGQAQGQEGTPLRQTRVTLSLARSLL
jgi:hypothetical protein